jgi:glycerol-3-phosphate O-acyltransferase
VSSFSESPADVDLDLLAGAESFRLGIVALAAELERSEAELMREARAILEELRTAHSPRVHRLIVRAGRALCRMGYARIDYDPAQVARLKSLLRSHPSLVLSSHRSYMDGGALTVGFDEHGLPPLTVFAGINMAFWPIGRIWRLANNVFIRRGNTGPLYKYVLRQYLGHLLDRERHLQWFIEGTRSRTGRLGPPRLGLLHYVLEAWADGRADRLALVPASVNYDQLRDVDDYVREARGDAKQTETLSWLLRFVRGQRGRFGSIYVRFGEPILVEEVLERDKRPSREAVMRLALEINRRIALATPVTGIALLATVLPALPGRAVDATAVRTALVPFLLDLERRGVPRAPSSVLETDEDVAALLDAMAAQGLLEANEAATAVEYRVVDGRQVAFAFYRNTIVHFLLEPAIAQLALLAADRDVPAEKSASFAAAANGLSELFAPDFFLDDSDLGAPRIEALLDRLEVTWRAQLEAGVPASRLIANLHLPHAEVILRAHVESLYVVAQVCASLDQELEADLAQLEQRCCATGSQLLAEGTLRCPDAVAAPALRAALATAGRHGLLASGSHVIERRADFAARIERIVLELERLRQVVPLCT